MIPVNSIIKWHSCYDDGWQGIIVPEAFSHPAKMSYGLLKRILAHAKEQGWLKTKEFFEEDIIVDPFGGIGSTGILGAYEGYQVVCCELEAKFVKLAEQNFKLHDNAWHKLGCPRPIILQGDSRRLCEVVEKADCIVSSPPYAEAHKPNLSPNDLLNKNRKDLHKWAWNEDTQGTTPGQLGAMKSGDVDAIISSPPYGDAVSEKHGGKDPNPEMAGGSAIISLGYSPAKDNLGNQQGDTFWQAAKTIVEQCHQILKPGGHAIWVTKRFVRAEKIVDFSHDWARLCESVGFEIVCWHKAMLVKETHHDSLFGGKITKTVARKSFFRRLAESKGSPAIDWEDVICMIKK